MPVSFSPSGSAGVSGGDRDAGAGISYNPFSGNVGATVQGGSDDVHVAVAGGFNPTSGSVGVTPTVQFGGGEGNQTGANVGGTVGTAIGSYFGPVGAAAGSAIGSAVGSLIGGAFNPSVGARQTEERKGYLNALKGVAFGGNFSFAFPDGSNFAFDQDSQEGQHNWTDPDQRVGDVGDRALFNYETDYTNDMDYTAGMAGISLSRLLGGGKNRPVDQVGQLLGNAFLGKVGYGAEFNQQNFNAVTANARAMYAQSGIQTKEDMLALANKAFSEGRVNDSDYAVLQQTASLLFDNNYTLAQNLMGGRRNGLETAARTPSGGNAGGEPSSSENSGRPQNRPGRIYSPVISPEEALLSVKPYFDFYRQNYPIRGRGASRGATSAVEGIGAITGIAAAYNTANRATGGALGSGIREGLGSLAEALGIGDVPEADTVGGGGDYDFGSGSDFDFSAGVQDSDYASDDYSSGFTGDDAAAASDDYDLGSFDFSF